MMMVVVDIVLTMIVLKVRSIASFNDYNDGYIQRESDICYFTYADCR